jgi:hypothetical protein
MLTRLIREALVHRDSERRHLAALLIPSSPFGSASRRAARSGAENIYPEWMRARLAILIRYLSNDTPNGWGYCRSSTTSPTTSAPSSRRGSATRATAPEKTWSPRERAKMYVLAMSGSSGLIGFSKAKDVPAWQPATPRWS